ncbi:hypothetical protein QJQ45_017287 [Haematococcus lacustris]|nr:hypothetical protein QJQ45_017287 [Haematococcus lacustris]
MADRLADRVAIITGGAKGIGLACGSVMARQGAKVVLADIDLAGAQAAAAQLTAAGLQAMAVGCDVRVKAQVEAAMAAAEAWGGGLDILVANAGSIITSIITWHLLVGVAAVHYFSHAMGFHATCIVKAAPFLDMSEEAFDEVVAVNLKGVFLTCQAAARVMVAQRTAQPERPPGAIITMSSVNAVMAIPSIAGYNAAKGGVNGLTKNMAVALAPHGIRVNAIGPGSINTDVLAAVACDSAALARVLSRTPLQRIGQPEEIGDLAAYLASSASSYITGDLL